VSPAFNTGCTPGCNVWGCSCTQSNWYYSSSSSAGIPSNAWIVLFLNGKVIEDRKAGTSYVRAVRGSSD